MSHVSIYGKLLKSYSRRLKAVNRIQPKDVISIFIGRTLTMSATLNVIRMKNENRHKTLNENPGDENMRGHAD